MAKPINDTDFYQLKDFIYTVSNIELKDNKKYLVEQRLESLLEKYNLTEYSELIQMLFNPQQSIIDEIISAITTNETSFFRDAHVFEAIKKEVIPKVFENARNNKVVIWSAACSTGQEPYTLAMMLKDYSTENNLAATCTNILLKASDLDMNVLAKARNGIYSNLEVMRGLPHDLKGKYFKKGSDGNWQIIDELRRKIIFNRMNLIESGMYPYNVDLILCRNVLIYFDEDTKKNIIKHMFNVLKPGGYFLVGSSESLYGINDDFERVEVGRVTMYRKP